MADFIRARDFDAYLRIFPSIGDTAGGELADSAWVTNIPFDICLPICVQCIFLRSKTFVTMSAESIR